MNGLSSTPEVSVIVPVRNGADSLPALLRSLGAQTLRHDRFEVIVVDNASSDGTAKIAESHGVRVVHEPVPNRARARNRGVAAASGGLYAFTDADCVADSRWLEALIACANLAPLVAGDVRLRVTNRPNAVERFEALWRFGQEAWVRQGWAATANLMVHAHAFQTIRGFDSTYRHYGEDADFCLRARRVGCDLAYCKGAVVEHDGERKLGPCLRRFFMHGYGGNQIFHRLGAGYRAWRAPAPALIGDRALRLFGYTPDHFANGEWRRMSRLARLAYAARIAGSIWAELRCVR